MARAICMSCNKVYKWSAIRGFKLRDAPCPYCGGRGGAYLRGPAEFGRALREQNRQNGTQKRAPATILEFTEVENGAATTKGGEQ